jgi:ABC-2 type transport system permease protein
VIKLLNLVQNENMKIYRRLRTWILLFLLVAFVCMIGIINHYDGGGGRNSSENWRASMQETIQLNQTQLQDPNLPQAAKKRIENDVLVNQYALEHNIPPVQTTMWGGVMSASGLVQLITLFTVIIAGDMVAGEFTWGTIKLLLIRPASRSKILLSKYLATLLFALLLLVVLFISAIVVNGLLFGFNEIGIPYLQIGTSGAVQEGSLLLHVLSTYGLKLIELVMVVTLAFMISTVFRSSSLSIGLSIFIMFAGQGITMLFMRYDWGKYFLFANTDLTQYIEGRPLAEGMTMGFSISVLIAYFILFNALSWGIFKKRDIAA